MPSLEIHPLSDLRDEAARLIGERFARQRATEPLLPDIDEFAPYLPDEEGVVATRGGAAVAYLAGTMRGDIATVGFAGCAASELEALRESLDPVAVEGVAQRVAHGRRGVGDAEPRPRRPEDDRVVRGVRKDEPRAGEEGHSGHRRRTVEARWMCTGCLAANAWTSHPDL